MSEHLTEEDRWAKRAEAERLYAPNGEANRFRRAVFQNRLIDVRFNPGLINFIFTQSIAATLPPTGDFKIADFCSGRGYLGFHSAKQLTQPGRSVSAIGYDKFTQTSWPKGPPKPLIPTHQCDLTEIDCPDNFFDAGLMRFAWLFIDHSARPKICERLFAMMKPGSRIVVLSDGPITEKAARAGHELFIEGIVAGGAAKETAGSWAHTASYEEIKRVAAAAQFEVGIATDLTDIVIGYNSPATMARSRRLSKKQKARLIAVYRQAKKDGIVPFEPDPNSLRMPWRMHTFTLTKPVREPV